MPGVALAMPEDEPRPGLTCRVPSRINPEAEFDFPLLEKRLLEEAKAQNLGASRSELDGLKILQPAEQEAMRDLLSEAARGLARLRRERDEAVRWRTWANRGASNGVSF